MDGKTALWLAASACWFWASAITSAQDAGKKPKDKVDIGDRLEPFVDDWLIDTMKGAALLLHHPDPQEVVVTFDEPCEGNTCCYVTVFRDDDRFRMYYRGSHFDWDKRKGTHQVACTAESKDGIHWTKPKLGLFEFDGSKENNIVWMGNGSHNFTPFRDTNPDCKPEQRYKAVGGVKGGLVAFGSPDGIHWKQIQEKPVITKGAFDSQNLAFWDAVRGRYVDFHRAGHQGVRHIMTCTSDDFIHWTEPEFVDFGDAPPEHLYTNAVLPYCRAPHIFFGFPKRFVPSRKKIVDHPYDGVSDGVFMTSRDGEHWHRWIEGFIRPGLMRERWWQRNNMTGWGILTTKAAQPGAPDELSLYSTENYYIGPCRLRRFTLRVDGFVSVNAGHEGGEFTTRPLTFKGKELVLNYATSAAGSVCVELLGEDGKPLPGFELESCPEIYGDELEHVVTWKDGADVSSLEGKPVRLRFALKDADLYSIRFRQ